MNITEALLQLQILLASLIGSADQFQQPELQVPLVPTSSPQHFSENTTFVPPTSAGGDIWSAADAPFKCEYPPEWVPCTTTTDRGCWLRNKNNPRREYGIDTDYEEDWPPGKKRTYYLEINEGSINADGVTFDNAMLFNRTYPGPTIQACWGDDVEITVKNNLRYNGTTIHMHGIRMLNTPDMDGVNGITQCPIAPGQNFTYKFKATQYGTTWYHSHYSLQYGDGLLGPLTIHGPSTSSYDRAHVPILMTDFNHKSAFATYSQTHAPDMTSILLNGKGSYAGIGNEGEKHMVKVKRGHRYLLRLINTSVDTTFIFTIDNHLMTVIGADLVPIKPYKTDHVAIGIGQRYNVILDADQGSDDYLPDRSSFWMRTIPATGCSRWANGNQPDERQGILSYLPAERDCEDPNTPPCGPGVPENPALNETFPTTKRYDLDLACRDEPYEKLIPYRRWKIPDLAFFDMGKDSYFTGLLPSWDSPIGKISGWSLGDYPMWLDMEQPTILNLNTTDWPNSTVLIEKNVNRNSWVYLVITGTGLDPAKKDPLRRAVPAAHPIHLHGHDFALLQQSEEIFSPKNMDLKLNNPPRRDVVLLPRSGFVVIAFKADNPGAWILHCHIAWHASAGLALQILENKEDVEELLEQNPDRKNEMKRLCSTWSEWYGQRKNHWDPYGHFQDDSAI